MMTIMMLTTHIFWSLLVLIIEATIVAQTLFLVADDDAHNHYVCIAIMMASGFICRSHINKNASYRILADYCWILVCYCGMPWVFYRTLAR